MKHIGKGSFWKQEERMEQNSLELIETELWQEKTRRHGTFF